MMVVLVNGRRRGIRGSGKKVTALPAPTATEEDVHQGGKHFWIIWLLTKYLQVQHDELMDPHEATSALIGQLYISCPGPTVLGSHEPRDMNNEAWKGTRVQPKRSH